MFEGDTQERLTGLEEPKPNKKKLIIIISVVCSVVVAAVIGVIVYVLTRNKDDDSSKELKFLTWDEAIRKAKDKLNDFTPEEKLSLLFGTQNMQKDPADGGCAGVIDPISDKFDGICLHDGPSGVRFSKNTQSWQAGINTAATFNKTLMYEVGKAQGKEFREKGVNVVLGPAMNIQRGPQGGRIWESFGDDPYLAGVAASQIIKGIQSNGVIACAKHFIGNDQETNRCGSSSNIKEQALWEIYMEPFYRSVKDAEVGSIMAAYNSVNDAPCVNNPKLVKDYLKTQLNFSGYVMSDWWAITSNDINVFLSGTDMNMPGGKTNSKDDIGRDKSYWSDFKNHFDDQNFKNRLDDAVVRILAPMFKLDQFNKNVKYPKIDLMKNTITEETKKLNRQAATESIVLLKNNDDILPLTNMKGKTIAIIGNDAFPSPCISDSDCSCKTQTNHIYKGHMAIGYGSGTTYYNYLIDPLKAITERAKQEGINIVSSGDISLTKETIDGHEIEVGKEDIEGAKMIAEEADLCIVFINADSGEEYIDLERSKGDRYDLDAWHSGNELVEAVLDLNKSVIIVINAPGPINLPFYDRIQGLLYCGFGGAESGNAIASVLFGDYNPSGHLPFVWGELDDYPSKIDIFSKPTKYDYNEGLFVGQRYFDKYNKKSIFPFGFGMSYAKFEWKKEILLTMKSDGLYVSFSISNIGTIAGEVVPMVFLEFPDNIETEEGYPKKIFKGFDKKLVSPNFGEYFEIFIDNHSLEYYNIKQKKFVRPQEGMYTVYVGNNAEDIQLQGSIRVIP